MSITISATLLTIERDSVCLGTKKIYTTGTKIGHKVMLSLTVIVLHDNSATLCTHSWDVGPAHIIAIDSEFYFFVWDGLDLIGEQYRWLEEDLKRANQLEQRAKHPWIITMYHHPMYCTTVNGQDCNHHESLVSLRSPKSHV